MIKNFITEGKVSHSEQFVSNLKLQNCFAQLWHRYPKLGNVDECLHIKVHFTNIRFTFLCNYMVELTKKYLKTASLTSSTVTIVWFGWHLRLGASYDRRVVCK